MHERIEVAYPPLSNAMDAKGIAYSAAEGQV